jgi:hypothetical protein
MKLKAIVHGQIIELPPDIQLSEGSEVTIDLDVTPVRDDDRKRLAKLQELFGCWRDQTDLVDIFEQIDRDRHRDLGRSIEL